MPAFLGAHSYTVRVKEDPPPGEFRLAGVAADFKSPVSLMIGDATYSSALAVGNSFSHNKKIYSLSFFEDPDVGTMLILTIRDSGSK